MSYNYEPVARQKFLITCQGAAFHPCNWHNEEAESAGHAEQIAKEHINHAFGSDADGYEERNYDHTVVITPVIMVGRNID